MSGVLDLPDEILGNIFLINTGEEAYIEPHDGLLNLLKSSHVCRRWREVATGFPLLWSRVINYERDKVDRIEELLNRSSPSLLEVGADTFLKAIALNDPRAKKILGFLFQHTSRIRTINLKIRFSPWGFISKEFLQNPAPSLEYLNIITSSPFPNCYHDGPLFANHAPLLRKLRMERCFLDFSSPVLHNLTQLSIYGITHPNQHPRWVPPQATAHQAPTPAEWTRILNDMPLLQYLSLSDAISPTIHRNDTFAEAHLRDLRLLSLACSFEEGIKLAEHLDLPNHCGIRVKFTANRGTSSEFVTQLFGILSRQLISWQDDPDQRYLQAKVVDGNRIHFGNSRRTGFIWNKTEEDEVQEHASTTLDPLLWIVLRFQSAEDTLYHFTQLFALYTRTYPSTTSLDFWYDEHIEFPTVTFEPFTGLKVLNLLEASPVTFFPQLFGSSPSTTSSTVTALLPSLTTLQLTRAPQSHELYNVLGIFLSWRMAVGKPLSEVQFIDSLVDDSHNKGRILSETCNVRVSYITRHGGPLHEIIVELDETSEGE